MRDPVQVKIAVSRPAEKIDQRAIFCGVGEKPAILESLLKEEGGRKRVIVFVGSKLGVKDLRKMLGKAGISVAEMHSDLEQSKREETIRQFKAGHVDVLVATDIMARGIDIDDITMVVNYDVPPEPEDYVHRIGRTARAGEAGIAVTFVSGRDRSRFARIEKFLGKRVTRVGDEGKGSDAVVADGKKVCKNNGSRRRMSSGDTLASQGVPGISSQAEFENGSVQTESGGQVKKKRRPYWKRRRKNQVSDTDTSG